MTTAPWHRHQNLHQSYGILWCDILQKNASSFRKWSVFRTRKFSLNIVDFGIFDKRACWITVNNRLPLSFIWVRNSDVITVKEKWPVGLGRPLGVFSHKYVYLNIMKNISEYTSSLFELVSINMYRDSNQSAPSHSLIRTIVFWLKNCWTFGYPQGTHQRLRSDCASLSIVWALMPIWTSC